LQQFRDDVRRALVLADVKNGDDIRMVQGCRRLRLAFESTQAFRLTRTIGGQNFDRHLAFQRQIAGTIHLAHPASSEERYDFIGIQSRSRCK